MSAENPFAAFKGVQDTTQIDENVSAEAKARERLEFSYYIERVFLVTLDKDLGSFDKKRPTCSVFLEELYQTLDNQEWMDLESMSQAMFERTLMSTEQLKQSLVRFNSSKTFDKSVLEANAFTYLSQCYIRACKEPVKVNSTKCKEIIIENASTCLRQPDLYQGQDIEAQMSDLLFLGYFSGDSELILDYLESAFNEVVVSEDMLTLCSILYPVLTKIHQICTRGLMGKLCADADASSALKILNFFTRNQNLGEVLLAFTNTTLTTAQGYENTLFGTILSSSCAPNPFIINDVTDLFANPSRMTQSDVERSENMAFSNSALITSAVYDIFMKLCKLSPRTKHLLLSWIGKLLNANTGRVKLASTMAVLTNIPKDECSDGLMLNLCNVLLRLCQPFSQPNAARLLKIRPQYCKQQFTAINEQERRHHHALGLPDETFLIKLETNDVDQIAMPEEYGFICDVYFLTQQALYLGMHATYEKFMNLNRELNHIQTAYQQIQQNPQAPNAEAIKSMFENAMKKYMGMRAALVDPELLKPALRFHIASSTYLTYLATGGDNIKPFSSLSFPLSECNDQLLGCMPEFIINNVTDAIMITRRFKESYFQDVVETAGCLMNLVLVFMGSKSRLKNPHLRAKLAEVLSEMMPKQDKNAFGMSLAQPYELVKERLFTDHPNISHLAEVLFNVFVSIETTGESVQFEQKLNYRQPMYRVIDYIWKFELHKKAVMQLSNMALRDIENPDPPLFLKFVNLLVNDANFLLDEALDYMKQIKEKEEEKERRISSDEAPLRGQELQQFDANLSQMAMLARFHNTAAVDTTHTLALLTTTCSELFCHSIMVDRICSMLNYFLLKLTGPQMREFKVKDFDKYEFKPAVVVSEICQIYLNMSHSDEFCQAVSADGRSYSAKLFPQAENILIKIRQPADTIQRFNDLAIKIQGAAVKQLEDDDLVASAPEEFLDPILGTLMRDPVILPSSRQVVDKSTIARHILSDQNDPFNRNPLALDQVIPNTELKAQIESWIEEQKKSCSASNEASSGTIAHVDDDLYC